MTVPMTPPASAYNDHSHIFLLLDSTLRQPQGLDHQDKGFSRKPEVMTWVETKDRSFRLATQESIRYLPHRIGCRSAHPQKPLKQ
jgi:hypothetical protein